MIEVTLISSTEGSKVGRFVSRSRANLERLGVNKNEFIRGFLKNNMDVLESSLHNHDLVNLINSSTPLNNKDISSIRYSLSSIGYQLLVVFVSDDEINPTSVTAGEVEYNAIDSQFIQEYLPVSTKYTTAVGSSIAKLLERIIKSLGFYDTEKFKGINNPLNKLIAQIIDDEKTTGAPGAILVNRIYGILEQLGIQIYAIIGE
jgi:hypothetical protein